MATNVNQVGNVEENSPSVSSLGNASNFAFFSSAAITFIAMMEMMKSEQDVKNKSATTYSGLGSIRLKATLATGLASQESNFADADSITNQSYEQWALVGSSATQCGMGFHGLVQTGKATLFSKGVDSIADEATTVNPGDHLTVGSEAPKVQGQASLSALQKTNLSDAQKAVVNKYKALLKGAGIHLDDYRAMREKGASAAVKHNGIDADLGEGITLRHVLSFADEGEGSDLRQGLRKGKKDASKFVEAEHQIIQQKVQIGNAIGQAGAATATSQMKLAEAQAARDKGAQALIQALQQANMGLIQDSQKGQSDQNQKFSQLADQVWSSINQLVQVDTKG